MKQISELLLIVLLHNTIFILLLIELHIYKTSFLDVAAYKSRMTYTQQNVAARQCELTELCVIRILSHILCHYSNILG